VPERREEEKNNGQKTELSWWGDIKRSMVRVVHHVLTRDRGTKYDEMTFMLFRE